MKITGTHLGILVIALYFGAQTCNANEVYINQVGDNLELTVVQEGSDNQVMPIDITSKLNGDDLTLSITQKGDTNLIEGNVNGNSNTGDLRQTSDDNFQRVSVVGSNNDVKVYQGTHSDGTVDVDETGDHEAYWTVTGDNNNVESYQTDENRGGGGGAAHHLANVVNGDNNVIEHTQKGKAGHDGFVEIQGDSNDVELLQRGNGGVKWADIVLDGDGHTVDSDQRGSGSANLALDLTNSGGAYSVTTNQNTSTTHRSYSLTGICTNGNGCAVTVTQY